MLHKTAKVEFYPLGIIGAIVSWNYPFHNIFNPMLAAVFSRNSIVIKVSENASWSGCFYMRIIQTALAAVGTPENLVEVIAGFAETIEALVSTVDKIIFVGSPGVGRMSLPFCGVKDSGFGRFAGIEGLHACCLVKSVVEDKWWPFIKTKIPKPIQYPIADNGCEFQVSLLEALWLECFGLAEVVGECFKDP